MLFGTMTPFYSVMIYPYIFAMSHTQSNRHSAEHKHYKVWQSLWKKRLSGSSHSSEKAVSGISLENEDGIAPQPASALGNIAKERTMVSEKMTVESANGEAIKSTRNNNASPSRVQKPDIDTVGLEPASAEASVSSGSHEKPVKGVPSRYLGRKSGASERMNADALWKRRSMAPKRMSNAPNRPQIGRQDNHESLGAPTIKPLTLSTRPRSGQSLSLDTPSSIGQTPTQMYQRDISPTDKSTEDISIWLGPGVEEEVTLGPLPSIPKVNDQAFKNVLGEIPHVSPLGRSIGKALHKPKSLALRTGSIVTVVTPEQTAWSRPMYLQGAIRLDSPAAEPRKGSIASLDAFQDAVEDLEAVKTVRRASDDAVIDEIVDFFESFGSEPSESPTRLNEVSPFSLVLDHHIRDEALAA